MNSKLAELFEKKHYWEVKRDNLYNRIMWDFYQSVLYLIPTMFSLKKDDFIDKNDKSLSVVWLIFTLVFLFLWLFIMVRNIFNCYYKLPRYRQKISKLDRQIVEELKKLNTQ